MAEYIMEARIRLRIKDAEDDYEGRQLGEDFFSIGLQSLAMSTDMDDDHYEIAKVDFLLFRED